MLFEQVMQALETVGLAPIEFAQAVFDGLAYGAVGSTLDQCLLEPGGFGVGVVLIGEGAEAVGRFSMAPWAATLKAWPRPSCKWPVTM